MVCFTMIIGAKGNNIDDCVYTALAQRDNMVRFQKDISVFSGKTGFPAELANSLSAQQDNITNNFAADKLGT